MDFEDTHSSTTSSSSLEITGRTAAVAKPRKKRAGRTRHPVYRGVRQRNSGKWVCEVRVHKTKSRIWLGTFPTADMAAVAHDVAVLTLRGENAPLNFPGSVHRLPRAASSSHQDIQRAAQQAARDFTSSPSTMILHNNLPPASSTSLLLKPSSTCLASEEGVSDAWSTNDQKEKTVEADGIFEVEGDRGEGREVEFVDEEATFNLPVLIDSMAEGMLLTPPAMKKGFNWSEATGDDHVDLTLWKD